MKNTIAKFLVVGAFNTILNFILLNIFITKGHIELFLSNGIAVTIGVCLSYLLNNYFVFKKKNLSWHSFGSFVLMTGISALVVQTLVIYAFLHILTISFMEVISQKLTMLLKENIAKGIAVIFGLIWNFVSYKLVVFKERDINPKQVIINSLD